MAGGVLRTNRATVLTARSHALILTYVNNCFDKFFIGIELHFLEHIVEQCLGEVRIIPAIPERALDNLDFMTVKLNVSIQVKELTHFLRCGVVPKLVEEPAWIYFSVSEVKVVRW